LFLVCSKEHAEASITFQRALNQSAESADKTLSSKPCVFPAKVRPLSEQIGVVAAPNSYEQSRLRHCP
jgi:hypothetical protein